MTSLLCFPRLAHNCSHVCMYEYHVKNGVPAPKYVGSSHPKDVALLPNTTWVSYKEYAANKYVSRGIASHVMSVVA